MQALYWQTCPHSNVEVLFCTLSQGPQENKKGDTMCNYDEALKCTAQELGIHVHGSHDGIVTLGLAIVFVMTIIVIMNWWVNY